MSEWIDGCGVVYVRMDQSLDAPYEDVVLVFGFSGFFLSPIPMMMMTATTMTMKNDVIQGLHDAHVWVISRKEKTKEAAAAD